MEPLSFAGLFGAGLLTFASPCVLPLIPLYLSFLSGASVADLRAGRTGRGLLAVGVAFSMGLTAVFVLLGVAAAAVGAQLEAHRSVWIPLAGVALVLFGLKLMGLLKLPFLDREVRPALSIVRKGSGVLGAFGLGAAFALGWTPCVGPVLGAALSFSATAGASPLESALYLSVFALGLTTPLMLVAGFSSVALRWMDRLKPHLGKLEKLSGAAVAAVGVLLLTGVLLGTPTDDVSAEPSTTVATAPATAQTAAGTDPAAAEEPAVCEVTADGTGSSCGLPAGPAVSVEDPVTPWIPDGAHVLAFESDHCPVCTRMKDVVASAERRCSEAGAPIQRVNVATSSGLSQARSRGVVGVPTYVFVDRDGNEVSRLIGEHSEARLLESIEAASGKTCGS